MSHHTIRIQILRMLQQCEPYALPEQSLRDQLRLVLEGLPDATIDEALKWLKAKAYIDFTVEEVTEIKRWTITPSGKEKLK